MNERAQNDSLSLLTYLNYWSVSVIPFKPRTCCDLTHWRCNTDVVLLTNGHGIVPVTETINKMPI